MGAADPSDLVDGLRPPASDLVDGLRPPGRDLVGAELAEFAGALARAPDRWRHLVRHTADRRVYELIWADAHVTAWVICWSAGQDTGFHDHGASAGGIHVVQGAICEERLSVERLSGGPASGRQACGPGTRLCVPACAIHRVFHGGGEPAVSLHAYSPPLTQMGTYSWGPDGRLEREPRPCAVPTATAASSATPGQAGPLPAQASSLPDQAGPLPAQASSLPDQAGSLPAQDGGSPVAAAGARGSSGRLGPPPRRRAPAVRA